jgi:hypothetical protein
MPSEIGDSKARDLLAILVGLDFIETKTDLTKAVITVSETIAPEAIIYLRTISHELAAEVLDKTTLTYIEEILSLVLNFILLENGEINVENKLALSKTRHVIKVYQVPYDNTIKNIYVGTSLGFFKIK